MPRWNTISVSGYHIREAGATAVQELAFTLADAIAYADHAVARGLGFDEFAPQVSFFFAIHNDFLEEIAKLRAARRLWSGIAKERYGSSNEKSMKLRVHAQTAGSTLTAQFPDANAVRVTLQCVAAVLGGAQSIHTNSRDEALAIPHNDAVRLALRTQQIVAFESGLASTTDPVGGSYAVEALTDELERRTRAELERIEAMGGMLSAIESGFVQREIQESAYRYQRAIESGERGVVGVNRYVADDPVEVPIHHIDPAAESSQVSQLVRRRRERDGVGVAGALERLRHDARSGANLMPAIVDAVRRDASVGEISDALKSVFGEYREAVTV
jgi:methylmalonyl-CoA mutase N-terminal domain/subunit